MSTLKAILAITIGFTTILAGCLSPASSKSASDDSAVASVSAGEETPDPGNNGGGSSGGSGTDSSSDDDDDTEVVDNDVHFKDLGTATATRSNYSCAGNGVNYKCYDLTVSCSSLHDTVNVTLYVLEPVGTDIGTIAFHSGAKGTGFWTGASTYAQDAFNSLNARGYRTIQVKWASDWLQAATSSDEGAAKLTCRPATVLKWIHENLWANDTAYCATGVSGGSVQIAYGLSHYGLSDILDSVVAASGPGTGDLQTGCLNTSSSLYLIGQTNIFDRSYGYSGGAAPCTSRNSAYSARFADDSIALGDWDYFYPKTYVWQVVGALDTATATVAQSQLYYDRMDAASSPLIKRETLANSSHTISETQEGAQKIEDALVQTCIKRH